MGGETYRGGGKRQRGIDKGEETERRGGEETEGKRQRGRDRREQIDWKR